MSDTAAVELKNPMLSDAWYLRLEYVTRVILPALGTLYTALAALWGFPYGPQVVGSIVAVDTFLGVFLGFAQKSYDESAAKYDGALSIIEDPDNGKKLFSLELESQPENLENKKQVVFKVNTSAL